MHAAALRALGLDDWRYQLLPLPPEVFAETVRALPAAGFAGINVTIPHKEAALALADAATGAAREIGAANTLTFSDAGIEADNTDAPGLVAALPAPPEGRRALVLGAGGSARAAVWALLEAGAADVAVWNRTAARAERLCAEIGGRPVLEASSADLLVNCTAAGLQAGGDALETLPVTRDGLAEFGCVVDLVYGAVPTALVEAARAAGVPSVDGLEVLVHQGALSLERWTGRPAPIDAMRRAVQLA